MEIFKYNNRSKYISKLNKLVLNLNDNELVDG